MSYSFLQFYVCTDVLNNILKIKVNPESLNSLKQCFSKMATIIPFFPHILSIFTNITDEVSLCIREMYFSKSWHHELQEWRDFKTQRQTTVGSGFCKDPRQLNLLPFYWKSSLFAFTTFEVNNLRVQKRDRINNSTLTDSGDSRGPKGPMDPQEIRLAPRLAPLLS